MKHGTSTATTIVTDASPRTISVDYVTSDKRYVIGSSGDDVHMLLDAAFGQIPQRNQNIVIALDGFDTLNGLYLVVDLLSDMAIVERQEHTFEYGDRYQATQSGSLEHEAIVNSVQFGIPRFTVRRVYAKRRLGISAITLAEFVGEPNQTTSPTSTDTIIDIDTPPVIDTGLSGFARAYERIRCALM